MIKSLKNNRGMSLIELITVMLISTILIMVSGVAISAFFRRYKVINEFLELQQGAMECLETIRSGYSLNRGEQFYGVANAKTMELVGSADIWNAGTGIKIYPPTYADYQKNDMIQFYLDEGAIKVSYIYNGIQVNSPQYLFPSRDMRDKIRVTKFSVANANAGGAILNLNDTADNQLRILEIVMEARIKVKDAPLPNQIQYKTINYRTYMVKK